MTTKNFLFAAIIVFTGCGLFSPEETKQDKTVAINPKLKEVLYWGQLGPEQNYEYAPNQGERAAAHVDNRYPIWFNDSTIYFYISNGGIFEMTIDPGTIVYKSLVRYNFSNSIWSLGFDRNKEKLFIIYSADGFRLKAVYVTLSGGQTTIDEEIIDEAWNPFELASWPGKPGVVFYGHAPQTGVNGFYWRYPAINGVIKDSLLYSITIEGRIARGFSISSDGKYLFFGTESGQRFAPQTQFMKLDISRPGPNPIVMAEREGSYRATSPNPIDPKLLLINYDFPGDATNPPQSHIELLNIETLDAIDLDVRTHIYLSHFTTNEYPSWSSDGKHFIFSAGAFDGEGGRYPLDFWIYQNVP